MKYKELIEPETTLHERWAEYYRKTIQGEFESGDTIEVRVNGEIIFTYTPQYSKTVFNFVVQDKGRASTEAESLQIEIDRKTAEKLKIEK